MNQCGYCLQSKNHGGPWRSKRFSMGRCPKCGQARPAPILFEASKRENLREEKRWLKRHPVEAKMLKRIRRSHSARDIVAAYLQGDWR